jgi:hypothetical protein
VRVKARTKATRALQIVGEQLTESWDYYAMTFFRKASDVSTREKVEGSFFAKEKTKKKML